MKFTFTYFAKKIFKNTDTIMRTIAFLCFVLLVTSCVNKIENTNDGNNYSDAIFQYSTKSGLLNNLYVGSLSVLDIQQNGDFGLGTFNMVDGEMVVFDGNVYQVSTSGKINLMPPDALSPFVVTKFFDADTSLQLDGTYSLDTVKTILSKITQNISTPMAIKIRARFNTLKSRSVDKVSDMSTTLEEIIDKQTIFDFSNVDGNVIGFWYPEYFDGVNFSGFHLHAVLNDLSGGGHLLNCTVENPTIELDFSSIVNVSLNYKTEAKAN